MESLKKILTGVAIFSTLSSYSIMPKINSVDLENRINNTESYQCYITPETERIDKYKKNIYCVRVVAAYEKKNGERKEMALGHGTLTLFGKKNTSNYFFTAHHIKAEGKNNKIRGELENKIWRELKDYEFKGYSYYIVDNRLDKKTDDDIPLTIVESAPNLDFVVMKSKTGFFPPENNRQMRLRNYLDYVPLRIGNYKKLKEGDIVFSIGYHYSLYKVVSKGIVSNKTKSVLSPSEDFLIDINLNPGGSGCPIFAIRNNKIELVGMFHQYLSFDGIPRGVHFAVPIDKFKKHLERYIK